MLCWKLIGNGKSKEKRMKSEFKATMRYFNAAYVKRFYGKWIA